MSVLGRGPKERVRVLVPRLATLEAAVIRAVDGAAELVLVGRPAVPARFLHRQRATIVPRAGDQRVDGTLFAVPDRQGRVHDNVLHFLRTAVPLAPRLTAQRREDARIELVRPAAMMPAGMRVAWLDGVTRNISAGGVLVAGADMLAAGDRLRLRFALESADPLVDVLARVVRGDDRWDLRGLRLEHLDQAARARIVRYVFVHQRHALAELRGRSAISGG